MAFHHSAEGNPARVCNTMRDRQPGMAEKRPKMMRSANARYVRSQRLDFAHVRQRFLMQCKGVMTEST
jgi:hypothetical protein